MPPGDDDRCSVVPNDLEGYIDGMASMRTTFDMQMKDLEASWRAKAVGNNYVGFPAPFDEGENLVAVWQTRKEFVESIHQAFTNVDGYDASLGHLVQTMPDDRLDEILGRSAEALVELGIDPKDAEKIASATPHLYDEVVAGTIDVRTAVKVAELTASEQRNVLSTDLNAGEIRAVLDGEHGDDSRSALLDGHGYRVRVLMLDEEAQASINVSDSLPIVLGDDEHLSFDEIEKQVGQQRAVIVAGYEAVGLSPDEALAAYEDLVSSIEFLAGNKAARMALDGADDDDSSPGDPDADNKFGLGDAQARAIQLLETADDSNSQRLWQRALQARMGTPPILVVSEASEGDAQDLIDSHFLEGYRSSTTFQRVPDRTDIRGVAAEIQALRRTDPEAAAALELAVVRKLGGNDRRRFIESMATQTRQEQLATAVLADGIEGDVSVDQAEIDAETERILKDSIRPQPKTIGASAIYVPDFSAVEVEYQLNELAKTNPALALMVKQQLDTKLSPDQVADVNRVLGESNWASDLASAQNRPLQGTVGAGKGMANGFIFLGNAVIYVATVDSQFGAQGDLIPEFGLNNSAERGGAIIGTAIDVALAGKGLIKIGGRWFVRNGDELTEIVVKNADEVGQVADDIARGKVVVEPASSARSGARLRGEYLLKERQGIDKLIQNGTKPTISNPRLSELTEDHFRPGATIGNGTTADAVRYERRTGRLVGGKRHVQKAQDTIRSLQKWLREHPNASSYDRSVAQAMIDDLTDALKTKPGS